MKKNNTIVQKFTKQRLTAFVDPSLIKRAKVRGTLEGLNLSEVVERALEAYAPKIETGIDHQIHIKFFNGAPIDAFISQTGTRAGRNVPKHTKSLVVPR